MQREAASELIPQPCTVCSSVHAPRLKTVPLGIPYSAQETRNPRLNSHTSCRSSETAQRVTGRARSPTTTPPAGPTHPERYRKGDAWPFLTITGTANSTCRTRGRRSLLSSPPKRCGNQLHTPRFHQQTLEHNRSTRAQVALPASPACLMLLAVPTTTDRSTPCEILPVIPAW